MEYTELDPHFHMMATTAIHQLGDISSDQPDLCLVYGERDNDWIGQWVTGFGFFNVSFPKATTRDLTEDEIAHYESLSLSLSGQNRGKIGIKRRELAHYESLSRSLSGQNGGKIGIKRRELENNP